MVASLAKVSRVFAGQYQQKPMPSTGNLVNPLWWKHYEPEELPPFDTVIISVDCAFKGGETSDYVAIHKYGADDDDNYLLEKDTRRLDYSQTRQAILNMVFSGVKSDVLLIEDKANGSAVISELKKMGLPVVIVAVNPEGGKLSRAMAAQPAVETGHYYLPLNAPWLADFTEQLALGPEAAKNDDDIDALSQYDAYRKNHKWAIWKHLRDKATSVAKAAVEKVQRKVPVRSDVVAANKERSKRLFRDKIGRR